MLLKYSITVMKNLLLAFFIALSIILASLLYFESKEQSPLSGKPLDIEASTEYPFLSKRIFLENKNDIIINFTPLREELRTLVGSYDNPVGLYFEYLPTGNSIGINEKESFFGASLLKIPVAMRVYKLIEQGKLREDQEVVIQEKHLDKGFGELWKKGAGTKITVKEAVRLAVAESDNTADKLLRDLVKERPVSEVFDYLDIPTNINEGPGGGVSPKGFASVLRSLYLSAYLTYDNSNKILDVMTTSTYRDRLAAGVPQDVNVAHKIGIYKNPTDASDQIHSDCGIIYVTKRPYLLCVMSNTTIENATQQISEISTTVYKYVNAVNK